MHITALTLHTHMIVFINIYIDQKATVHLIRRSEFSGLKVRCTKQDGMEEGFFRSQNKTRHIATTES